jgi:multiple sugar transport system substrate-binding protein
MTNKIKKILILVVTISLTSLVIYFSDPNRKIILTVGLYTGSAWDVPSSEQFKNIDTRIKRFEKKYPNVEVKYTPGVTKEEYSAWLSSKIINGQEPDVFMILNDDFNLLADTHALLNLNSYVFSNEINASKLYSACLNAGLVNNSQYALPFESNPMMMCVNLDLLKKEHISLPKSDWTFEDFYNICRKVTKSTKNNGAIDQFGTCGMTWQMAMESYGISLFNEAGTKAYFNSEKVRNALTMYEKLTDLNKNYTAQSSDFDAGKVVFMPMSLAEYRTYKPYPYKVARYSTFQWSILPMPGARQYNYAMETSLMGISSHSAHKTEAWRLLKMATLDTSNQQENFDDSAAASPLKSVMLSKQTKKVLESDDVGKHVLTLQRLNQMMSHAKPYPRFKKYYKAMEMADYLINQSIASGTVETDQMTIQRRVQNYLNEK